MDTGKVIVSIVAGAAAGALLGVLFAPDKGTETRRKMIQRGDDFARNIKTRFNEYINNFTNTFGKQNFEQHYTSEPGYREQATTNAPVI